MKNDYVSCTAFSTRDTQWTKHKHLCFTELYIQFQTLKKINKESSYSVFGKWYGEWSIEGIKRVEWRFVSIINKLVKENPTKKSLKIVLKQAWKWAILQFQERAFQTQEKKKKAERCLNISETPK